MRYKSKRTMNENSKIFGVFRYKCGKPKYEGGCNASPNASYEYAHFSKCSDVRVHILIFLWCAL